MAPTTRSNQHAYCKVINKDIDRERVPFHKDKGFLAFLFFAITRKMDMGFTLGMEMCLALGTELCLAIEIETSLGIWLQMEEMGLGIWLLMGIKISGFWEMVDDGFSSSKVEREREREREVGGVLLLMLI